MDFARIFLWTNPAKRHILVVSLNKDHLKKHHNHIFFFVEEVGTKNGLFHSCSQKVQKTPSQKQFLPGDKILPIAQNNSFSLDFFLDEISTLNILGCIKNMLYYAHESTNPKKNNLLIMLFSNSHP